MATVTIKISDTPNEEQSVCVIEVSTDWKEGEPESAAVTTACGLMNMVDAFRSDTKQEREEGGAG